ncbi:wsc domain-containing protein [Phlyctema vagabunda]|uniref:Wsc domain-containing protein n=1 Tax=Phlyctema vagabunda TaxID=108571 RepID=A0ABR4P665_9HELO
MLSLFRVPLLLAAAASLAKAQQYQGEAYANSLPGVPGSELAYFKISDPSGGSANLTLANYISHNNAGKRVEGSSTKRVVIVVHGAERDPGTYMSNLLSALSQVPNSDVDFDSVAICAPYFPNGADKTTGYPWTEGLANGRGSTSSALVWSGTVWADGGNNMYPYKTKTVSSYEALDQLLKYFDDSSIFPNMQQIVIAGHSLGAQFVQRYAAVANELGLSTPISYWVGNPNSYLWFSETRPLDYSSCSTYDDWREGLSNYDAVNSYGSALVAEGREAVLARYNSRSVNYGRGVQDLGDTSSTCAPRVSGGNRNERFFNFIRDFPPSCPSPDTAAGPCSTIDYIQTGHDAGVMFASAAGQARLFLDNFNGTGARAYDFGHPRRQTGDDPLPDPAFNSSVPTGPVTVYAGNMTFAGCFTDQTPKTLGYTAYSSSDNTIDKCTSTCDTAGYTIAGTEYGSECYCGNVLTARAEQVVDSGCSQACPGNTTQTCGASSRLSVYSNGTPTRLASPSAPATIGNFTYEGCRTEGTNVHAFPDASTTSNSMTLEKCAEFCVGYNYFGTEYASECYCGQAIGKGSAFITRAECSMTCSGNSLQPCGAGNRLTWYADENKVEVVYGE